MMPRMRTMGFSSNELSVRLEREKSVLESKIIGLAPSDRLGTIRVIVVLCAIFNVVFQDFNLLAQAAELAYRPEGLLQAIPGQWIDGLFHSETALLFFKAVLLLVLLSALAGFHARISLFVATVLYAFYLGVFRAGAWSLDNGILPLYLMFIMIWLPSGETFSFDQWRRRDYAHLKLDDRPSASIGWSIFLVRSVLVFSYFQSALSKIQNTGWGWVRPWRLRQFLMEDSLIFSHAAWIPHFVNSPDAFWALLACSVMGLELFFPGILLVRNFRILYLLAAVLVRSLILIPQNIFFHDLILLQFIFYDWDRILPLRPPAEHDRRKGNVLFRIKKT